MTDEQFLERTLCTYALETLTTCRKHLELLTTDRNIPDESVVGFMDFRPEGLFETIADAECLLGRALARFDEHMKQKEKRDG